MFYFRFFSLSRSLKKKKSWKFLNITENAFPKVFCKKESHGFEIFVSFWGVMSPERKKYLEKCHDRPNLEGLSASKTGFLFLWPERRFHMTSAEGDGLTYELVSWLLRNQATNGGGITEQSVTQLKWASFMHLITPWPTVLWSHHGECFTSTLLGRFTLWPRLETPYTCTMHKVVLIRLNTRDVEQTHKDM